MSKLLIFVYICVCVCVCVKAKEQTHETGAQRKKTMPEQQAWDTACDLSDETHNISLWGFPD